MLRTHMARSPSGAAVASLSTPWGEAQTPGTSFFTGGYHLVWPRDQVGGRRRTAGRRRDTRGSKRRASMNCDKVRSPTAIGRRTCGATGRSTGPASSLARPRCRSCWPTALSPAGGLEIRDEVRTLWPTSRRAIAYIVSQAVRPRNRIAGRISQVTLPLPLPWSSLP